jgi:hypothetical protein
MWQVNIVCDGEAWKQHDVNFKMLIANYESELIVSKKMPDGQRIMGYKIEDISDAESLIEDCAKFAGFSADFESL